MKHLLSQIFFLSLLTQYNKIIEKGGKFMANKRTLKKAIWKVCDDLLSETIALSLYGPKAANEENVDAQLWAIVKLHDNYINRISHPEPGIPAKVYFKDLREKFSAEVNEIIDQING